MDAEGKELSKSAVKNLKKQYDKQKELYDAYLKSKQVEENKEAWEKNCFYFDNFYSLGLICFIYEFF